MEGPVKSMKKPRRMDARQMILYGVEDLKHRLESILKGDGHEPVPEEMQNMIKAFTVRNMSEELIAMVAEGSNDTACRYLEDIKTIIEFNFN